MHFQEGDCSGKRWAAPAKLKLFICLTSQLKLLSASTSINFVLNYHRGTKSATKQHAKERIEE